MKETEGNVTKLERGFRSLDHKAKGKSCKTKGSPARNAALISAVQKIEHHEFASYGALHEWAELLSNRQAAALLEENLGEEKAAKATLTKLALEGR